MPSSTPGCGGPACAHTVPAVIAVTMTSMPTAIAARRPLIRLDISALRDDAKTHVRPCGTTHRISGELGANRLVALCGLIDLVRVVDGLRVRLRHERLSEENQLLGGEDRGRRLEFERGLVALYRSD